MSILRLWLLPGFVLVTLLTALAMAVMGSRTGADIAARVDAELVADGQAWATPEVDGRMVALVGLAPTLAAQRQAVVTAGGVWGVAGVVDKTSLLPLQPTYRWSAARNGNSITLTGFVPSANEQLAVLAMARRLNPGLAIEDQTQLARGQPVDFLGLTEFSLARLAELAEGSVELVGPSLSINGTAVDEPHFKSIAHALTKALPPNAELRQIKVLPPKMANFVWQIDLERNTARITGYVPSESNRHDIAAAIQATSPDIVIDDQTQLASGAPEGFASAAIFAAYQLAHLASGTIKMEGKTLSLIGKAKTVLDYETALVETNARRNESGEAIAIGEVDVLPASVDPYVWRGERSGEVVVLTGYMPTLEAREQVVRTAGSLLPGLVVTDHLKVADGDPKMDWIGAVSFGLRQLSKLSHGSVSLTGKQYDIAGEAISLAGYAVLSDALGKTLPASMVLRHNSVAPATVSPYLFAAVLSGGYVTLSGYVPTVAMAQQFEELAKRKFGESSVDSQLQLASGAPDRLSDAVEAGMQAISRLSGGRLDLTDNRISLYGITISEGARLSIERTIQAALPGNFQLATSFVVAVGGDPLTGADCQAALRSELNHADASFKEGTAELSPDSEGLIDRLAAIIQRCPIANVEIAGRAETGGNAKKIQALSEDRASVVLNRLVEDGVRRERLKAVGYGPIRPVAPDASNEGRGQSRRIDLNIVDP